MHNIRQLYPTVKCCQAYLPFSKPRVASIARYIRRYGSSEDEKKYSYEKANSDSNEGKISGRKDSTHEEHPDSLSEPNPVESSPSVRGGKEHQKYYSLKNYREGPNTESGKLASTRDQEGAQAHNKDVENRFEKR